MADLMVCKIAVKMAHLMVDSIVSLMVDLMAV